MNTDHIIEKGKYPQRKFSDTVVSKGYTSIPNGLINNSLGLTQAERLFIQYLLQKPDGHIFYARLIERNTGIDRGTINKIKNKLKFLKYTDTGTGAYKSGWTVDFTGLWALIEKSKKENIDASDADVQTSTPNPPAKSQTSTPEAQKPTPKEQKPTPEAQKPTPNPPLLNPINTIIPIITEDQEEFDSSNTTRSQGKEHLETTKEFESDKHKNKIIDQEDLVPPDAFEAELMASLNDDEDEWEADQRAKEAEAAVPIRERIIQYFSSHHPSKNDYTNLFKSAQISDDLLERFWAIKEFWASWKPIATLPDKSLYILKKNIENFVPAIESQERRNAETRDRLNKAAQEQNQRISKLRKYVWMNNMDAYDADWHWATDTIRANFLTMPKYLVGWMSNPYNIKDGESGCYSKDNIMRVVKEYISGKEKEQIEVETIINLNKDDDDEKELDRLRRYKEYTVNKCIAKENSNEEKDDLVSEDRNRLWKKKHQ